MPIQEQEWLWDQRLITGGTSMLVGRPKTGKTICAENLALKASRGEPFLGLKLRKTPVVYLALEGSKSEVIRQVRAIGGSEADTDLHFHFGPIITTNPLETAEAVRDEILKTSAGLVVVDTMVRLFPYVQSLDDYAEVTRALAPMEAVMRQTGAHIVFLMHQGKAHATSSEISILGSTALYAVPDTAMEIVRDKDGRRIFRTIQRYGDDMEPIILGGGTENEKFNIFHAGSAEDVFKREMIEAIIAALESDGELNGTDLAGKVPGRSETYYEALTAAKSAQIVLVRKEGRSQIHSLNPEWEAHGGIEAAL
jgi:KaiC/GvpD/RAD55 family RecA-like ATPase